MSADFLITYTIMGLFFFRQAMIFRQPNKINYAPLILGVGAIGSMVHLLLHPEGDNLYLVFRESLLPLFAGLVLFIVMNVLQQARRHEYLHAQQEFAERLIEESERLRKYIGRLEANQHLLGAKEDSTREQLSTVSETEHRSLETIRKNQKAFVEKIESMQLRQEALFERLEQFTQKEMPDLDNVVHRHIDMLRIAEQDHFNKLEKHLASVEKLPGEESAKAAGAIESALERLEGIYRDTARTIAAEAGGELGRVIGELSDRFTALKLQGEGFATALSEDDNSLRELKTQSELLMKQILLCAKNMNEIVSDSERIRKLFEPLGALSREVSAIHGEYVAAKLELEKMARDLEAAEKGQVEQLRRDIEALEEKLSRTIDDSLGKLHEHYHIAQKELSNTVQELSARAKLQQSYGGEAPAAREMGNGE
jgi:hypothetical protein